MAEFRNPALTVDAACRRDEQVLLIRRGRPPWKGAWALPGGFVDEGEDPRDAVLRELLEETGLSGEVERIVDVRGDPARDPRKHIVTIVYEVVAKGEPVAGDDAADAAWYPIADVLAGKVEMAGDHGDIIRCWIRG